MAISPPRKSFATPKWKYGFRTKGTDSAAYKWYYPPISNQVDHVKVCVYRESANAEYDHRQNGLQISDGNGDRIIGHGSLRYTRRVLCHTRIEGRWDLGNNVLLVVNFSLNNMVVFKVPKLVYCKDADVQCAQFFSFVVTNTKNVPTHLWWTAHES